MKDWEAAAAYCEDIYGIFVDYDEGFFICPECDEPLLLEDWEEHDWQYCPVCKFVFCPKC